MRRIAIILCVILLSINIKAEAISTPIISAQGAVLMDLNSGQVLFEKNSHNRYAPASTTKVMTALLTLEKCKLDDKVIASKKASYEEGSKIYLIEGEEVTVQQLLYSLLLVSANDAAVALAEHISGSEKEFAKLMNTRARELGCTDTNFVNSNGLYVKEHYTSAHDLALITAKAMEIPTFRQMVSTTSYNLNPTNKQSKIRHLYNHNKLLATRGYKYSGADGVKTGYTIKSKHTYVGSATRNGRTLIAVFLCDDKGYYKEAAHLFDYGFSNFTCEKILSKNEVVSTVNISGSNDKIPVYPEKDFSITIPKGTVLKITKKIVLNNSISKIVKGQKIGTINITYNGSGKASVNLVSATDYSNAVYKLKSQGNGTFKRIFKLGNLKYLLIAALFIFLLRGFYRKYKRRSSRIKF